MSVLFNVGLVLGIRHYALVDLQLHPLKTQQQTYIEHRPQTHFLLAYLELLGQVPQLKNFFFDSFGLVLLHDAEIIIYYN